MIRTVIIDDATRNIKLIAGLIKDHCPQLEIAGTADDLSGALLLIRKVKPSLLLLDIEFPNGTIFSILEELPAKDFQVIFITAHNSYAAEAFQQNATDYILKPVTKEALVNAVKRAEAKIRAAIQPDVAALLETLSAGLKRTIKKIPLPSAEGLLFINETDIIRCEASGRYTIFYLDDKSKLTITRTLKETEALLDPGQFFRIHHSHIINLEKIRKYHRRHGGLTELTDGSLVEVAASRKQELLNLLLHKKN